MPILALSFSVALFGFSAVACWAQSVDPAFNCGTDSHVYALAAQPRDRLLVAGAFSELGDKPCAFLGRINAEGALDLSFRPKVNGVVRCLAVQSDGRILLGGQFSTVGGRTCNRIARLNPEGSLDTSFEAGLGANSATGNVCEVTCIALQDDGKILLGGSFDRMDRSVRNGIARLNADGSLDSSFNPDTGGVIAPKATPGVFCIAVQADGKIIFGGQFIYVGDERRNGIARVSAEGVLDKTFNPSPNPSQFSALCVLPDGKILVGGGFRKLGGLDQANLARLNADGTADPTFLVDVGGAVTRLAVAENGEILVAGHFNFVDRQPQVGLAGLTTTGARKPGFSLDVNGTSGIAPINAFLVQSDGSMIVGGSFNALGGESHRNLARFIAVR
jgi:uncharacterized delta-60 repeat protein